MTIPETVNQNQDKLSDKELNFRALEARYQQKLQEEIAKREEAERRAAELSSQEPEEVEDDEPYVDKKKLAKQFSSFEKKLESKIDKRAEEKAKGMIEKQRREDWLKNNPDFFDVLQHAEKFAMRDPELAETILQMPEGFERQKLVYRNIKSMGLDKPEVKQPSIQEKIDANRKSPYYQPSGVGSAPYGNNGDFSVQGQKSAYDKMQELKSRLRI